MELTVGTIITGKVTSITKFGAFVALPDGKSGLVHISEVAGTFVSDVHDFLTQGQEVPVKVLSISPEGKISLSVKQITPSRSKITPVYFPMLFHAPHVDLLSLYPFLQSMSTTV